MATKTLEELPNFEGKEILQKCMEFGKKIGVYTNGEAVLLLGLGNYIFKLEEKIKQLEKHVDSLSGYPL